MGVFIKGIFSVVLISMLWACDGSGGKPGATDQVPESNSQAVPAADANGSADANSGEASDLPAAASDAGGKGEATEEGKLAAQGESSIWVQEARGDRQCEGGGKTLEQSSKHLVENGVKVQESRCGVRTDRMYPSVCGGATGNLLMHRIPASFLDSALQLGFDPAKSGQYRFSECPNIPPSAPRDY